MQAFVRLQQLSAIARGSSSPPIQEEFKMHQAHPLSTLTADPSFPEQFNLSRKLWSIPSVAVATNIWLCEDDSDMQGDKRRILTHYGVSFERKEMKLVQVLQDKIIV